MNRTPQRVYHFVSEITFQHLCQALASDIALMAKVTFFDDYEIRSFSLYNSIQTQLPLSIIDL